MLLVTLTVAGGAAEPIGPGAFSGPIGLQQAVSDGEASDASNTPPLVRQIGDPTHDAVVIYNLGSERWLELSAADLAAMDALSDIAAHQYKQIFALEQPRWRRIEIRVYDDSRDIPTPSDPYRDFPLYTPESWTDDPDGTPVGVGLATYGYERYVEGQEVLTWHVGFDPAVTAAVLFGPLFPDDVFADKRHEMIETRFLGKRLQGLIIANSGRAEFWDAHWSTLSPGFADVAASFNWHLRIH